MISPSPEAELFFNNLPQTVLLILKIMRTRPPGSNISIIKASFASGSIFFPTLAN